MANTSSISFYMLLCLIFLSSHAICNARPFAHLLIPTNLLQENKDNDHTSVMLPAASISKKLVLRPAADHQNSSSSVIEDVAEDLMKVEDEDMNRRWSNKVEGESSSVVYHVPPHHDKKRENKQQSGFNLDYAPPKTHPPVHN